MNDFFRQRYTPIAQKGGLRSSSPGKAVAASTDTLGGPGIGRTVRALSGLEVLGIAALFATVGRRGADPELLASAFRVTPLRLVGGSGCWYPSSRARVFDGCRVGSGVAMLQSGPGERSSRRRMFHPELHMERVMPACFNTAALTPASRQAA
jgi:hypothetical protein